MEKDSLEQFLDEIGIQGLCNMIAEICNEKADHVRTNWQDENLAKKWEVNAEILEKTAQEVQFTG